MAPQKSYILSFTGVYFQYPACLKLAELYEQEQDWEAVRTTASHTRLLQSKTKATDQKRLGVLTRRLATLSSQEWAYFYAADPDSRRQLVWLATLRYHQLIWEFLVEVLREKYLIFDTLLLVSDFERFWEHKAEFSAQLEKVTPTTQRKVRNVIFRMLQEAGWIRGDHVNGFQIAPPVPTEGLIEVIAQTHPHWLQVFLLPDRDLAFYQNKYAADPSKRP